MVFTIIQVATIGLLLWAIGDHQYDYYRFMRFVVCAVSGYAAFRAHELERKFWVWVYLTVAVLFNPFATVHLDRERWAPIDLGVAVIILIGIFVVKLPKEKSDPSDSPPATPPGDSTH